MTRRVVKTYQVYGLFGICLVLSDDAVFDAWKNNQLEDAEALMTTAMHQHQHPGYHFLPARALVRARLQQ